MRTSLVIFFGICVFFTHTVCAQDAVVTCFQNDCDATATEHFFSTTELWYPGKSLVRTVTIENKSDNPQTIGIEAQNIVTVGQVDEVMHIVIDRGEDKKRIWNGPLSLFYDTGEIVIHENLTSGTKTQIVVTIYMYMTAEDEYQNMHTQFDLDVGFIVQEKKDPKPCLVVEQPQAPGAVSVQKLSADTVSLRWDMVTLATGYTIMWGTDTEAQNGGLLQVGKTSGASIRYLTQGAENYYFKVRPNNNCLAGIFSSPAQIITPTPAPVSSSSGSSSLSSEQSSSIGSGSFSSVFVNNEESSQNSSLSGSAVSKGNNILPSLQQSSPEGEVKGARDKSRSVGLCNKTAWFFLFFMIILIFTGLLIVLIRVYPGQKRSLLFAGSNMLFIVLILIRLLENCLFSASLVAFIWTTVVPLLLLGYTVFVFTLPKR